ncbi:MAG: hypothetical protein FWC64_07045 [Treponema sp.]|nr:hypothetical protein [Treponema sp.]
MADLTLRLNADFEKAQKAFSDLRDSSEETAKKMDKFAEKFKTEQVDRFVERQKLTAIAMQATGRETESLGSQMSAYQREIERLIKSGLSPQDEAIQRLQAEYTALQEKQEAAKQATKAEAEAAKALVEAEAERAAALEKTAKETVELLTASSDHERQAILLKRRQGELREEMERLIASGIDPQSEQVRALQREYERLTTAKEQTERGMKMMATAAKASATALAAVKAAAAAAVVQTAAAGDRFAKTARQIGMCAETLQELEYAARQSGGTAKGLTSSLQRLNRNVGDVRNGTGALTKHLGANNQAMLDQLKNVNSNEEAFNLLLGAIRDAPDEFERAQLAYAAFGRAGQEMILLAKEGADGIAELRGEARRFGIISNETAAQAEEFATAQDRLRQAIGGARNEMAAGLIPTVTSVINKIADFIANIDNLAVVMRNVAIALAGVTAGISAFMVIAKLPKIITAVTGAVKGLTLAMKANPFGLIAVAVALLITSLILLKKNWDVVQTYLQQGTAHLVFAFRMLGSRVQEIMSVAFSVIKAGGASLIDFIHGNIIRAVGAMLEIMGRLPFVGQYFERASQAVNGLGNAIGDKAAQSRRAVGETIENARREREEAQETHRAVLQATNDEARARREALRQREADNEAQLSGARAAASSSLAIAEETENELTAMMAKSLRDRLALLGQTEAQGRAERGAAFEQFMRSRLEAENLHGQQRIEFLRQQAQIELDAEKFSYEERLSAREAFNALILAEEQKLSAARLAVKKEEVNQMAGLFGNMSNLVTTAGKESVAAAIAGRALSAAQAGINSFLAFSRALAEVPFPANKIAAAGVLASGLAQQTRIIKTPIPQAETGGRFVVPNTTSRVDGVGLMVGPNETVDITPAGQQAGVHQTFNLVINGETIASVINELIGSGDIQYEPLGNL